MAKRIQRKRSKGWKMPENTVYVGRPTKWGNPFKVGERDHNNDVIETREDAAHAYAAWWQDMLDIYSPVAPRKRAELEELRSKDLACWCPLDEPCHADVLLELANA